MVTTMRRWNPWQELEAFRREVDGLFGNANADAGTRRGPVWNAYQNDEGVILTAELPGYDPEAFEVETKDDSLRVRGRREEPVHEADKFLRRERGNGEFEQTLRLPFTPDAEHTEAEYRHGILTLRLRKSPEEQPRKIAVKTA